MSVSRVAPDGDHWRTLYRLSYSAWTNLFTFNLSPGYHHRPDRLQHRARAHPGGGGAEAAEAGRAVPEDGQEDARHRRLGCDPHPSTHHPHRHEDVTRLRLGFFNQLTFTNREKSIYLEARSGTARYAANFTFVNLLTLIPNECASGRNESSAQLFASLLASVLRKASRVWTMPPGFVQGDWRSPCFIIMCWVQLLPVSNCDVISGQMLIYLDVK